MVIHYCLSHRKADGVNSKLGKSFTSSFLVFLPYIWFTLVRSPSSSRQNYLILLMGWFEASALMNCLYFNALFKHWTSVIFRPPSLNSFLIIDLLIQSIPLSISLLLLANIKPKIILSISFMQLQLVYIKTISQLRKAKCFNNQRYTLKSQISWHPRFSSVSELFNFLRDIQLIFSLGTTTVPTSTYFKLTDSW